MVVGEVASPRPARPHSLHAYAYTYAYVCAYARALTDFSPLLAAAGHFITAHRPPLPISPAHLETLLFFLTEKFDT